RDRARHPVVAAGEICAGIMNRVGMRLGSSPSGDKIAVAEREKALPSALYLRVEPLVRERPRLCPGLVLETAPLQARVADERIQTMEIRLRLDRARIRIHACQLTPADLDLAQVRDDHIGAVRFQRLGPTSPVDADDEAKPASTSSRDASSCVLDHDGSGRWCPEAPRCLEERVWSGLAAQAHRGPLAPIHDRIEQPLQTGSTQYLGGVPARGDERDLIVERLQAPNQGNGRWIDVNTVAPDLLEEKQVLAPTEAMDGARVRPVGRSALRQRHPACAEKGADRVGSRPAINIGQVVLRRERRMAAKVLMGSLLQKPVKHPRPDLGVDACRVGNNAIEIKQRGVEPRAHEFDAVGRLSHCDKAVLLRSVAISLPTEPLPRSCHGEAFHPVARFASITRIQAAPPLMLLRMSQALAHDRDGLAYSRHASVGGEANSGPKSTLSSFCCR